MRVSWVFPYQKRLSVLEPSNKEICSLCWCNIFFENTPYFSSTSSSPASFSCFLPLPLLMPVDFDIVAPSPLKVYQWWLKPITETQLIQSPPPFSLIKDPAPELLIAFCKGTWSHTTKHAIARVIFFSHISFTFCFFFCLINCICFNFLSWGLVRSWLEESYGWGNVCLVLKPNLELNYAIFWEANCWFSVGLHCEVSPCSEVGWLKVRLIAKGYTQTFVMDYFETLSCGPIFIMCKFFCLWQWLSSGHYIN